MRIFRQPQRTHTLTHDSAPAGAAAGSADTAALRKMRIAGQPWRAGVRIVGLPYAACGCGVEALDVELVAAVFFSC